jgi:HAE1 family hydrophobic/amphiphilic exporter-1
MHRFFINRPIVAIVIAIFIVIVGVLSLVSLPVTQYPAIIPPEVNIQASFIGADAQAVEQSVTIPIEMQMSGIDKLNYFTSTSQTGSMRMTVDFDINSDPDIDQMLTLLRQSQASPQLPADVRNFGVTVQKSLAQPVILFALYSPGGTWDASFLANYAYINLVDRLTRVHGIASVTIFGAGQYAMRCWVRPDILAKLNITIPEIVAALQAQNNVNPAGQIGSEPVPRGQELTYTIQAQGRLITPEQFEQIVIRAGNNGAIVRLKDVARVELGVQDYSVQGKFNGKPAAIMALFQLPGTNALNAVKGAKAVMEDLKKSFPPDLEYTVAIDTTLPVTAGIEEIIKTIIIAILLVTFVVFVFLQGWRATIIPVIAVPVSLIGAFAFFPLLHFSINPIALMAMVVAIGLVVDDAIVVVEAVTRHIEEGMTPKDAAIKAMDEVAGPVVAIALVLSAVFLPTIFLPGITGRLYQQFAITIAISVLLSAFNALSLSPALCALLLRPGKVSSGFTGKIFARFNRVFKHTTEKYVGYSGKIIKRPGIGIGILVLATLLMVVLGYILPGGFLPEEDQGYLFAAVQLPNGASLQRTNSALDPIVKKILNTPGVQTCTQVSGFSMLSQARSPNYGFLFIKLTNWSERNKASLKASAILQRLMGELNALPQAITIIFSPPSIPGVGTAGGVTFILEDRADRSIDELAQYVNKFLAAARKRKEITQISTTLISDFPQYFVDVDRDKVLSMGVPLNQVYGTLQTFFGGLLVNYFNRFGRQWQVYLQAEGEYRTSLEKINQFHVRNDSGQTVPLSAVMKPKPITGPLFISHFNLNRSAQINVTATPGYSSSQVMSALEQVFSQTMPSDMGFNYGGISFQENQARHGIAPAAIFALSIVFVFLILAALYESWSLPFSVLLDTPVAVFGAFVALMLRGFEFNIYAQIGVIVLIGLAAKNAILIVEFAKREHERGKEPADAALTGARLRFRPILMTSFAFILGMIPMAIAGGSGALARKIVGTDVIGGMLAATLIAIFIIPMLFYLIEKRFSSRQKV